MWIFSGTLTSLTLRDRPGTILYIWMTIGMIAICEIQIIYLTGGLN